MLIGLLARRRRTSRSPAMQRAPGAAERRSSRTIPTSTTSIVVRRRLRRGDEQHRHDVHRAQADKPSARRPPTSHRPPAPEAREGRRASRCSCSRCRTCASAAARRARSTSTRCRTPTSTSCASGRRRCSAALRKLPELRDVDTDQQTAGLQLDVDDRSRHRRAPRHQPQRRSTTRSTTRSASARSRRSYTQLNQYRVVLEATPRSAAGPDALDAHLRARGDRRRWCRSSHARARRAPRRRRCRSTTRASSRRRRCRSTSRPASRSARRSTAIDAAERADRHAARASTASFQGTAQAFQDSLAQRAVADPGRAVRRLHRARHALRELHPPDHDPLDAAVGGRWARCSRCSSAGTELSIIALIGIILLIGIVKKNAIMMIDFALEARARRGRSTRGGDLPGRACCASARS